MVRPVPQLERRRVAPPPPRPRPRWVSARAVLLALLFTPAVAYWASVEGVDVILSLMVPPVACTFLVVILNAIYARLRPGRQLNGVELVVFNGLRSVSTSIASE